MYSRLYITAKDCQRPVYIYTAALNTVPSCPTEATLSSHLKSSPPNRPIPLHPPLPHSPTTPLPPANALGAYCSAPPLRSSRRARTGSSSPSAPAPDPSSTGDRLPHTRGSASCTSAQDWRLSRCERVAGSQRQRIRRGELCAWTLGVELVCGHLEGRRDDPGERLKVSQGPRNQNQITETKKNLTSIHKQFSNSTVGISNTHKHDVLRIVEFKIVIP